MNRRSAEKTRARRADRPLGLTPGILIAFVTLMMAGLALLAHPVGDYHAESDFYGGIESAPR